MPDRRGLGQPGLDPAGRRATGTMFAALCGQLTQHAWRDPDSELDAYLLFYQRSLAMGWLDDRSAAGGSEEGMHRSPGLWGMHDAGWHHPLANPGAALVSWFQVGISPVPDDRPLPVRPFLRCAEDATAHLGTPLLSSVELLLPVQGIDASARPAYAQVPAMQGVTWFAEREPKLRTSIEISVQIGEEDVTDDHLAEGLAENLDQLDQNVFIERSLRVKDPTRSLWVSPPLPGMMPPRGVALTGQLTEWSCDAVGWVAEVLADLTARLGLHSPLLLSVTRVP